MIAVDTNVLLRLIIADDDAHFAEAAALLASHELYVSLTVALETEWVLRSRYRLDRAAIHTALASLFALSAITVERPDAMNWALARYADGGDFADLVHVAGLPESVEVFASFDRAITRAVGGDSPVAIMQLGRP